MTDRVPVILLGLSLAALPVLMALMQGEAAGELTLLGLAVAAGMGIGWALPRGRG